MAPKANKLSQISSVPTIGKNSEKIAQIIPPNDAARNTIASRYVYSFLFIISVYVFVGLYKNFDGTQLKDGLLAISGVLSGPLGFIIGYYFKTNTDK